jgi:hypothetical protein
MLGGKERKQHFRTSHTCIYQFYLMVNIDTEFSVSSSFMRKVLMPVVLVPTLDLVSNVSFVNRILLHKSFGDPRYFRSLSVVYPCISVIDYLISFVVLYFYFDLFLSILPYLFASIMFITVL